MTDYYTLLKNAFNEISLLLTGDYDIRPDNVYQEGNVEGQEIIGSLVDKIIFPESRILNSENLKELFERSKNGESCLIMAEHYSNFDWPIISRLIENDPNLGLESAHSLIPMQGMKLNNEQSITSVFTKTYSTIVIYTSKSAKAITELEKKDQAKKINYAAMRELTNRKYNGQIILVFPAATRFRPGSPETKKGDLPMFSYLKFFENILFLGINGNIMKPHESEDMNDDVKFIERDLMLLTASPIIRGRDFIKEKLAKLPEGMESKQYVVDQIMNELEESHNKTELIRQKELEQITT